MPGEVKLFNLSAIKQVDWADPDMEGVSKEPARKKIFVKGFPQSVSEEALRSYFNDLCQGQVQYIMTGPTYGFITFHSPQAANLVMEKKDELRLAGKKLTIAWWVLKKRDPKVFDEPPPRSVLTPSKQSVNQPLTRPLQISSPPRPLEELLHLTRVKGWGDPQYRVVSHRDPRSGGLLYQYSVTFPAVPFKINGVESSNKYQAFANCAELALAAIRQERVSSPDLLGFKYIPHPPSPSCQSSLQLNLTNLRI